MDICMSSIVKPVVKQPIVIVRQNNHIGLLSSLLNLPIYLDISGYISSFIVNISDAYKHGMDDVVVIYLT
jgi:hypothetical protein